MTQATLMQNFGFTHYVLSANLDGISHADSLRPAADGANSLNGIVGHIVRARAQIHDLLGLKPVIGLGRLERYKQRQPPVVADGEGVLPFDELVAALNTSQEAVMGRLAEMGDEELAAECAHVLEPGKRSQVGVMLAAFNFHEAYHAGQTGLLRRIVGKPGALPGPED